MKFLNRFWSQFASSCEADYPQYVVPNIPYPNTTLSPAGGISRTLSTDSERRTQSADRDVTPKRHGSLRLKNKSESFDLTPR